MFPFLYMTACAAYAALVLRLARGLSRPEDPGSRAAAGETPSVTVLIAARDEARNLPRVLDALLAQEYPRERLEILVIDDRSADGTQEVLEGYSARHPDLVGFLRVDSVPEGMAPKKHALLQGLRRARGEWIAVTDADCEMGPRWLASLAREFTPGTGMVLGITVLAEPAEGTGPLEGARALEFASYGIAAAALVGIGFPVIANANNLAYRRRAFDEAGGFGRHGGIVSGDDDFTLQEIHATGRWAIRYCVDPESRMRTAAPDSWRHFWEQRKRWAGKCVSYRPRQTAFLAVVFAFYLSIPALLIAGGWKAGLAWLGAAGFAAKAGSEYLVMRRGLRLFGLSRLLRHFPLAALLHIPLIVAAVAAGTFGGFTWKGQKLSRRAPGRLPARQ